VVGAIDPGAVGAAAVSSRESLAGQLGGNPFGVGILGALLIGVLTVTIIGTIGFVVSTLASIEERLEEFSILEALGLSGRQLGAWMALESVLVVSISVVSGLVLGTVLAWIVLPSASMTADGSTPVPAPALVIPWLQLVALAAGAFLVAGASTLMARRQLSRFAVKDALRGDA
jgi:ABC-type antimicrobial peptide transport system permease subunit